MKCLMKAITETFLSFKHHIIVFPQHNSITKEGQIIIDKGISVIHGALILTIIRLSQTLLFDFHIIMPGLWWALIICDK